MRFLCIFVCTIVFTAGCGIGKRRANDGDLNTEHIPPRVALPACFERTEDYSGAQNWRVRYFDQSQIHHYVNWRGATVVVSCTPDLVCLSEALFGEEDVGDMTRCIDRTKCCNLGPP